MNYLRNMLMVQRGERAFTALMSLQFFLIIAGFWILKPLKKTLFIAQYDDVPLRLAGFTLDAARAELVAKNVNMVAALGVTILFALLARRSGRRRFIHAIAGLIGMGLLGMGMWLPTDSEVSRWAFYVFGDVFNMLLVTGFFAFLNDTVRPSQVERLYGPIVLGGVAGGVAGAGFLREFISSWPVTLWLALCGVLLACIVACAAAAGRIADRHPERFGLSMERPSLSFSVISGLRQVASSRYLLSIATIVGLYEIVSTIIDYQFTSTVAQQLDGPAIGAHFATVYMVVNAVSLSVQLLLTSALMRRLGVGTTLLFLPAALFVGSLAFVAAPVLLFASFLCVADNGLSYSIQQSSKESLYVITRREEKYSAKGFIDIAVQRLAKAVGVNLTLGLSLLLPGRWLGALAIGLILLWWKAARYCGDRFEKETGPGNEHGALAPELPTLSRLPE